MKYKNGSILLKQNNKTDKKKKDGRRGSFVLRKEKLDADDNSESDMDVSGTG